MAKAKSAKSVKSAPVSEPKPKKSVAKAASKTPAGASIKEAAPQTEFTHIAIGHAAGDVWGVLSQDGPKSLAELKKAVKAPGDVVMAAVGWLAREDKLEYVPNGRTVKIGLR